MSDIVFFDPNTNYFLSALPSQNSKDYLNRPDVIIYQDATAAGDAAILAVRDLIGSVDRQYLIVDNGTLREMTDAEKAVVDQDKLNAQVDAATAQAQIYLTTGTDPISLAFQALLNGVATVTNTDPVAITSTAVAVTTTTGSTLKNIKNKLPPVKMSL